MAKKLGWIFFIAILVAFVFSVFLFSCTSIPKPEEAHIYILGIYVNYLGTYLQNTIVTIEGGTEGHGYTDSMGYISFPCSGMQYLTCTGKPNYSLDRWWYKVPVNVTSNMIFNLTYENTNVP